MAKPETLRKVLKNSNTSQEVIDKINKDFEDVTDKSSRNKKAKYLFHAVSIMDAELDESTRQEIMESCACTIGSSVDKKTERFAKRTQNLSLEEKIQLLYDIKHLGNPVLQTDGTIRINQGTTDNGIYRCPCPQINGAEITEPKSLTYCGCCGGHFKYQYEKALAVKLNVKQISSSLESAGKMPCVFILSPINNMAGL